MTRPILFQIHWLLGITAGLVLAVMGVTGALLSFEDEILAAFNPGVITVEPDGRPLLAPPDLARKVIKQVPQAKISRIVVQDDPAAAARVSYSIGASKDREIVYVEPTTGRVLGPGGGHGFFETVTRLHRYLALPGDGDGWGRQITGFSALALIFFALSGLYLRWPRKALDWRAWLVLDLRKTGRNLYHTLHAVIGGWVLIFYLLSGLTGLWWSYGWYRDSVNHVLVGEAASPAHHGGPKTAAPPPPDPTIAWRAFEHATAGTHYSAVTLSLRDNGEAQFRAKLPNARHDRVSDELTIDGRSGEITSFVPYAQRTLGQDIVTSIYELHRGAYFGLLGRIGVALASLTMPLFTITGFLLYFARRRRKQALKAAVRDMEAPLAPSADAAVLVAFASQTGSAERLARLTAKALPGAVPIALHQVDAGRLAAARRLLVVASTYGEGEPPDAVRGFARRMMGQPGDYSHLDYAVLALGDREYDGFCAFGHEVDRWLHANGAMRLFDLIEMDGDDADAQRQWQQQLAGLGARTDQPDWAPAQMGAWRLVERTLLNPGSSGEPAFHIALEPLSPADCGWTAGDIVEIMPRHDPRRIEAFLAAAGMEDTAEMREALATRILPSGAEASLDSATLRPLAHREYSIASLPTAGRVELIVRLCRAEDGFLGLGSGWLCDGAPVGGLVSARVRPNPAFHPPEDTRRPLVLIGNGTGLAGLLAHLRHRAALGGGPCWLFWGERHPGHDAYHAPELDELRKCGVIEKAEYAWSRAPEGRAYVQDKVAAAGDGLRGLIDAGASIYVCGSVRGMAPAVHQALALALGTEALEAMAETGRYRRDIY